MENSNGLVVQADLTPASGTVEREAAIHTLDAQSPGSSRRITLGADKGYDVASFVGDLRQMAVTPHIARDDAPTKTCKRRRSAIDARSTRHPGYAVSLRLRKRIEEAFGWAKSIAGLGKTKVRGTERVAAKFTFTTAACNLIRMPRWIAAT